MNSNFHQLILPWDLTKIKKNCTNCGKQEYFVEMFFLKFCVLLFQLKTNASMERKVTSLQKKNIWPKEFFFLSGRQSNSENTPMKYF